MAATKDRTTGLVELAELVLRISREIDPHGAKAVDIVPLTGTEALALRWIESLPGSTASEAAAAMSVKLSNLSVAVRGLVAKGLVRRQLNPNDARATELYPTDLARDNVARLHAHWASLMRKAFGSHVPDLDETLTVLRRADAGIRRHNLSMGAD